MAEQLRMFTFLGTAIKLHVSWLPIAVLLLWGLYYYVFPFLVPELRQTAYRLMAVVGLTGLFVSVLLREMARAVGAMVAGISQEAITLYVWGGVAVMPTAASPKSLLVMAGWGFLASLLLAAVIAWLLLAMITARTPLMVIGVGFFLVLVNLALAVGNFIPVALLVLWRCWTG